MEELFSTDRQLPVAGFPEELTPFPDPEPQPHSSSTVGFFYPQSTPLISSPAPQKLRPIRSNGKNPPEYSASDDALLRINGCNSSELGFLQFQSNLGENGGNFRLPEKLEDDTSADALLQMKSEMDAHLISNFKSQISHLNFSFSSSSDCSGESEHKVEEPSSSGRPRKKRRKRMELFLENLMSQVIHKQEQMHYQLMDLIEKKEKERITREEAWHQREMERAKRAEQIRAQEAARSLALISFIRNALGVTDIQVPELLSLPPVFSGEEIGDPQMLGQGELDKFDPNNKRWPTSEVQALITLRAALDDKFRTLGAKAPVWEEVSAGMAKMGYVRSAKKCKEKWENVNKYYKKATGNGKKPSENAKSCPYFHELETLYRNRLITAAKANSPSNEDPEQNGIL
ncbi:trihelix transcription factor GT-2 [Beta vulgaris subsp. vulgaris]|uniref:trihelix transcription factor GT-2 n=1 Tax=Beta vulgaris subsp. vulgaris TaxID=3555 RepID=UPI0020372307|nr:trihelix transcription factor GT-2 [Beta vulgaris subsp. vulgaris]